MKKHDLTSLQKMGIYIIKNKLTAGLPVLLKQAKDLDKPFLNGQPLLSLAVHHNFYKGVDYILSKGANPNTPDNCGNTPLHFAVSNGDLKMSYKLIRHGADPIIRNNKNVDVYDLAYQKHGAGFSNTLSLILLNCEKKKNVPILVSPKKPNNPNGDDDYQYE